MMFSREYMDIKNIIPKKRNGGILMKEQWYDFAGDLEMELNEIELSQLSGGVEAQGISQGNDGKICTLTWECGLCPTHTCFC